MSEHDNSQPESLQFEVGRHGHRERADRVVQAELVDWSRSRVHKLFAAGLVWRDEDAVTKSQRLFEGDVLTVQLPPPRPLELRPVDLPLELIYEDDSIVVVNKSPGMVVHPGAGTGEDTLVHALLHHCHGRLSGIGGVERPGIVHRLDRETSGLIVVAKSDPAYQGMTVQFSERSLEKEYVAIVDLSRRAETGESGEIREPIGRHPIQRHRMAIRPDGRPAHSIWALKQKLNHGFGLMRVRILTGRTHQIRVHLAHLGMPLVADTTYGYRESRHSELPEGVFPRVMLHAAELRFSHPVTGEPMQLKAPPPADFRFALDCLGIHPDRVPGP